MRARRLRAEIAAVLRAAGAALALGAIAAPARAQCPTTTPIQPNLAYPLNDFHHKYELDQQQSYWAVIGIVPQSSPVSDWDLELYSTPFGGAPTCASGLLASSSLGTGSADFVVADFNHNPYGTYYARAFCYGGDCGPGLRGLATWRSGGQVLSVDGPAIVEDIQVNEFADEVARVYDVFLLAGQQYWFLFRPTGDRQTQLFLFRNPSNGVYWAGRSAAVLTAPGCATYTAPTAGWYGVVVANDRRSSSDGGYTLGIYTSPQCGCAADLAVGASAPTPVGEPAAHYRAVDTRDGEWQAIAVRGTSGDWDLEVGTQHSGGPDAFCMAGLEASSAMVAGFSDFIAARDPVLAPTHDTLAVRAFRYAGTGGATIARATSALDLEWNDPVLVRNLAPGALTDVLSVYTYPDVPLEFEFTPYTNAVGLWRYGSAGATPVVRSRAAGQPISTGTTVTTTSGDWDALVAAKDSAQPDAYAIRLGTCVPAADWSGTGVLLPVRGLIWFRLPPAGPRWTAFAAVNPTVDWDLESYRRSTGGAWPVCLDSIAAVSAGSGVADVLVGDLRHGASDSTFVRLRQFSGSPMIAAHCQWRPQAAPLTVNAPAIAETTSANANVLRLYEVELFAGTGYTIDFARLGPADTRLLVFGNPGATEYWAGRSARLLEATGTATFVPNRTGVHAIAIVNENLQEGAYSIAVTTAADAGDPRAGDRAAITALAPNPGAGPVTIAFTAPPHARVALEVVDAQGRRVAALEPRRTSAGGTAEWSGLYLVRLVADGRTVGTRKLVRLR